MWRAGQVRASWVTQLDRQTAGFWDAAQWEEAKRGGEAAIKRWIHKQLDGTSVTVVLIGAETADRRYVRYEIQQSRERGNGMLGIYINNMKDQNGRTDFRGRNPLPEAGVFDAVTYDWVVDGGFLNTSDWIESAFQVANRR